jgi:hypothetical protein
MSLNSSWYFTGGKRISLFYQPSDETDICSPQNRICQRRFQADMERYLGVPAPSAEQDRQVVKDRQVSDRIDVNFDTFSIGKSKQLQRVFFEVVPEGQVGFDHANYRTLLTILLVPSTRSIYGRG